MRFEELRIRGFLSFSDTEQVIKLGKRGLVLIEGENLDDPTVANNGCLVGDTLIDGPRDLRKYPRGIPIKDLVGQRPWVYAWDGGRIVVRQASRVWRTARNAVVWRVTLTPYATKRGPGNTTGRGTARGRYRPPQEIVGTYDHPVLLSDGFTWKKLGQLQPGDSVCSLYRRESGGWRTLLYWTNSGTMQMGKRRGPKTVSEQQFVCEAVNGPAPTGHDAHHKDDNAYNHSVDNMEWKLRGEHQSEHTSARNRAGLAGWQVSGVHPRGMQGKKHTKATRQRISETQKQRASGERVNHTVLSVTPAGRQDVYDMTVPGTHNFVANGVVVHNSGKSSVSEALLWALFGSTVRGVSGDDVVHRASTTGCKVTLRFANDKGEAFTVERHRNDATHKNKLLFTGPNGDLTSNETTTTEARIRDALGMDFETFTSAVIFGQGQVKHFSSMTDKEMKRVTDKLIGIEALTDAHKAVASDVKDLTDELEALESHVLDLSALEAEVDAARGELADWSDDHEEKKADFLRQLSSLKRVDVTTFERAVVEAEGVLKSRNASHELARTAKVQAAQVAALARQDFDRVTASLLSLATKPGMCGHCGSTVDASGLAKHRSSVEFDLALETERLRVAKAFEREAQERLLSKADSLSKARVALDSALAAEKAARAEGAQLVTTKRLYEEFVAQKNPHVKAYDRSTVAFANAKATNVKATAAVGVVRDELAVLGFIAGMLSDKGSGGLPPLKGLLVESVAPFVNKQLASYSRVLTDGNIDITFETQTRLKNGEMRDAYQLKAVNRFGADAYAGSSGGERRKIDAIIFFAFQALAASRSREQVRFAVWDEVFDALDETAQEVMMDLLLEEKKGKDTVFVITQRPELKGYFPSTLRVVKHRGVSSVQQGTP